MKSCVFSDRWCERARVPTTSSPGLAAKSLSRSSQEARRALAKSANAYDRVSNLRGRPSPPTLLAPPSASARLSLTSRSRHLIPCSRARMRRCTVRNTPAETASMWPKKKWRTSGLVSSPRPAAQSRQAPSLLRDGRGAKRHSDGDFKSPPNPPAATSHLPCSRYDAGMQGTESHSETLSLEFDAARAGAALACAYSNSAEFDAALIAARRAAGVYGPKRHRRQMILTAAGIAAGLLLQAFLIG